MGGCGSRVLSLQLLKREVCGYYSKLPKPAVQLVLQPFIRNLMYCISHETLPSARNPRTMNRNCIDPLESSPEFIHKSSPDQLRVCN